MNSTNKAILFMILSVLSFSIVNYFIKSLSSLSSYQILLFRSIPAILICLVSLKTQKISILGNQKKLLLTRSLVASVSVLLYYASTKYLPIGIAATVRYLAPIFAVFFAIVILKNKFQPINVITTILAFFGIALVAGYSNDVTFIGMILVLLSALSLGASFVLVTKIGSKDSPLVVVFYFSMFGLFIGGLLSIFNWNPITLELLPAIVFLGIAGFFAQFFLTKAFQIGDPRKIAPIKYFEILVTMGFGFIFFNEGYSFLSILGALILIFSLSVTFLDMDKNGTLDKEDFKLLTLAMDVNDDGVLDFKDIVALFKQIVQNIKRKIFPSK